MQSSVIIYYVRDSSEKRPGEKVAKASFVNISDALVFWQALSENRRRYLRMETVSGEPVKEVAHTGFIDYSGTYAHAYALTGSRPLPPRERDRESAEKCGWKFTEIEPEDMS